MGYAQNDITKAKPRCVKSLRIWLHGVSFSHAFSLLCISGPLLKEDGSTYLFYRADGLDIPFPTCSNEGISMTHCPSDDEPCNAPNDLLIFGHTGEDPSVFVDHRGYYHMLFNALPYKCVPKFQQGGHAWSLDGINWSTPRIGAFDTTIHFTDGTSMECEVSLCSSSVAAEQTNASHVTPFPTTTSALSYDASPNRDGSVRRWLRMRTARRLL